MKLFRFGEKGKEKPGVLHKDLYLDVSQYFGDYDECFFAYEGLPQLKSLLDAKSDLLVTISEGERIGPPIARPSKIVCIGLNYADHAAETGASIPSEPVVFLKATTAISGPHDEVIIPRNSEKTDWEVELAVIIGKKASYIPESEAMNYVAGYCLHNDVSERAYQLERGGTWDKGKGCDTFAPLGPWLVTKDEIENVNNLRLWLTVNDKKMQDGTTANLIFDIPRIISYLSQFMTLLPGDVISTGTPAGVGMGLTPQQFLQGGDVIESGITGLGVSRQTCKFHPETHLTIATG